MKKVFILTIPLLLSLPFLMRTARAQAPKIMMSSTADQDVVRISFSQGLRPEVRFAEGESCWEIDFRESPGLSLDEERVTYRGPVKLMWLTQPLRGSSLQTLTIYVQQGAEMRLRRSDGGEVEFVFRKPSSKSPRKSGGRMLMSPQPLLAPEGGPGGFDIEVKGSSPLPVVSELIRGAGIQVRFRDPLPKSAYIRVRGETFLEGLGNVADQMGMVLTEEEGQYWLSDKRNPLLLFPSRAEINAKSPGLKPLRELVIQFLGEKLGSKFCGLLPQEILGRVPDPRKWSRNPRDFFQSLLQSHGVKCDFQGSENL